MSLDVGKAQGTLDLDTTSFKHGFEEAHTHAEHEGGKIREVMESIAEILGEVVGPALTQFGQELQSAFAGFSEGPAIGALNLVGLAAGSIREATEGAGEAFHKMGLEATKAGVSVEFLSKLSAVSGTVGVSLEQLGVGFKIMEQRAVEATEGNKKTAEAFDRLGISVEQAGELSKEPEKLFEAVQKAIAALPTQAERTTAALAVMGRQGASLAPIFTMSREEFDKTGEAMERLGGTMTDQDVKQGEALGKLEGFFHAAFLGIERAASAPVLQFFEEHMEEIEPKLEALAKGGVVVLSAAWEGLGEIFEAIRPSLEELSKELNDWVASMGGVQGVMAAVIADFKGEWPEIKSSFHELMEFLKEIEPLFIAAAKSADVLGKAVRMLTPDAPNAPGADGQPGAQPSGTANNVKTEIAKATAEALVVPGGDMSSLKALYNTFTIPGQYQSLKNGIQDVFGSSPPPESQKIPPGDRSSASNQVNHELQGVSSSRNSDETHGGKAEPSNVHNHFAVNVSAHLDPNQTASAIAAQLLPKIKQLQKDHDQKAAGAASASAVAASLGGS